MSDEPTNRNKKGIVVFKPSGRVIEVEVGTLLSDAAVEAGVTLHLPCGGQGRCGRCRVKVEHGAVSHRSGVRLSASDLETLSRWLATPNGKTSKPNSMPAARASAADTIFQAWGG